MQPWQFFRTWGSELYCVCSGHLQRLILSRSLHRLSRWHLHQLLERDCVRLVRGGDLLELWWKQCLRRVSDWRFYGRGCGNYHFGLQVRRGIHWTV